VGDWLALFFAQKVEVGSSMHSSWKSLGFWPNSFEGVLGVERKSRGFPFLSFIAFLCDNFLDIPPPSPCVHLSMSGIKKNNKAEN